MAAIRFLRNLNLKVVYNGVEGMVPFGAGDIFNVIKIEKDPDGYNNIHMPDGSVINGVDSKVFEHMGKVPVIQIENIASEPENFEIETEEPEIAPTILDGTMLGKDEPIDAPTESPPAEV